MEYHEAASFLFDLQRFRPRPGTATTAAFLDHLGDPHDPIEFVQVAGSNGKGSTARMVEQILGEAGYSVGLYTSPHLEDLRERIRVDGRKIPRSQICAFVEAASDYVTDEAADGTAPTFFETMTTMALWHFGQEAVDIAVLEVGIGGRYDATSVVDPVASAVTSVTLEHTGIIGETEAEIARDKAHVAPDRGPLVTAVSGEALEAVTEIAGDVCRVGTDDGAAVQVRYGGPTGPAEAAIELDLDGETIETAIPLIGRHQAENAGIAAILARQAGGVERTAITRGLRNAHWPGRFEVLETDPLVVLDGAHNPGACEQLADTLSQFSYDQLHLVIGALHDKDHRGIAEALPTPDRVIACEPDLDRAEDRAVLGRVFGDAGADTVTEMSAVRDALERSLETAESGDCILVTGSLYTVAEARRRWSGYRVPKRIRDRDEATATLKGAAVTDAGTRRMRSKAVHRVVRTRVQYRQAAYLKQELLSIGGECAISGVQQPGETVDIVLMGTASELGRLARSLDDQPYGLAAFGSDLRHDLRTTDSGGAYPWLERPSIMGICNVTPDSFHDGGEYDATDAAVERARTLAAEGAAVVDIGGESTRPGADPVDVATELDRVVPVIEQLGDLEATISVDTRKAEVARGALEAGAGMINDVSGLGDPEMRFVAAEYDVPIAIMHSIETPVAPDRSIAYDDVVEDVIDELGERILLARKAGLDTNQILVDPGLGFGKSAAENFTLLDRLGELRALGCPILVGHSHKSMFSLIDRGPEDRLPATVGTTALAVDRGADLVRVHDVEENRAALETARATRR